MSFHPCRACLFKNLDSALLRNSQQPWTLPTASTSTFATSAFLNALPPKKKAKPTTSEKSVRGAKQTFTKKKKKSMGMERGRKPAPGERKALRKRVVLSNTNALEVHGLQDISVESITNDDLRGQVLGIPGPIVDRLRAVDAFKVPQGWALFRRPAMLMRQETLDFGKEMENLNQYSQKKTIRRVLVGERGCGKTLMLLQAMTMAFLKDWVVVNIPNGIHSRISLSSRSRGPLLTPTRSPRPHPRPDRIRTPPLHHPDPLYPTHLHRLPPFRHIPCQPDPLGPPTLPSPSKRRYSHPHSTQYLSRAARAARSFRFGSRLADFPAIAKRPEEARTAALDALPGRLSTCNV